MFIVIFDDQNGFCIPYGWDVSCEGAIETHGQGVALFETRKLANTAITISRKFAELQKAQGKPFNSDFSEHRKFIRIVPATTKGGE